MAKDKILKVVTWTHLRTSGIKVKSLIKYFAAPKREDNIRLVYDATTNRLNECTLLAAHHRYACEGVGQGLLDD